MGSKIKMIHPRLHSSISAPVHILIRKHAGWYSLTAMDLFCITPPALG